MTWDDPTHKSHIEWGLFRMNQMRRKVDKKSKILFKIMRIARKVVTVVAVIGAAINFFEIYAA